MIEGTLPVELPDEHREALDDPPEFTHEQEVFIEAAMALWCCHTTGMHNPKHWLDDGTRCGDMHSKAYKRAVNILGIEPPIHSAPDCFWCRSEYRMDDSPYDSDTPTFSPPREGGE